MRAQVRPALEGPRAIRTGFLGRRDGEVKRQAGEFFPLERPRLGAYTQTNPMKRPDGEMKRRSGATEHDFLDGLALNEEGLLTSGLLTCPKNSVGRG